MAYLRWNVTWTEYWVIASLFWIYLWPNLLTLSPVYNFTCPWSVSGFLSTHCGLGLCFELCILPSDLVPHCLAINWPWFVSWHCLCLKFLYLVVRLFLIVACIPILSLLFVLLLCCPAVDNLRLVSLFHSCLLIRCYHVSASRPYPVVRSHLCLTSNSWYCLQHRPTCHSVLTSPVTTTSGVGQEEQEKPLV